MRNETHITYPEPAKPIEIRMYDSGGHYIKVMKLAPSNRTAREDISATIADISSNGYVRNVHNCSTKTIMDFAYALIEMFGEGE